MSKLRSESGFTLVELMVVIVLTTIVLGAAVTSYVNFLAGTATSDRRADSQDRARRALDVIGIELRSAMSASQSGTQPIEDLRDYSLIYLEPVAGASLTSNPLGLQHVRYCVDTTNVNNEVLWRQAAPYNTTTKSAPPATGTAACPSSAWGNQTEIASKLVNAAQTPTVPFFTPVTDSSGSITDVGLRAYVATDPTKDKPVNLQSSITLRNLNHRPVAAISCTGASNGHVICDASGSTDQDGQTLTFAWAMDGSALTETSYRLDKSGLVAGSSHTFTVTVTDTGGLSNSASWTGGPAS